MMPEIVRRLPEILRRCYHEEEGEEECRRKSASSSAEDQENFFRIVTRTRTRDPWIYVLGT